MFGKLTTYKALALILLLNILLGLHGLWVPYYNIDELTNALFAKLILAGDMSLKDFLGNTYLLTHYLYVWIFKFFPGDSLVPVHITHTLYKCGTALAFFWAGRKLSGVKTGVWAALFYVLASVSFMSKDFFTPSAESFSLLPAVLAAGFYFKGNRSNRLRDYFVSGAFVALATFFKAPMGVLLVATNLVLLLHKKRFLKLCFVYNLGFLIVLFLPFLFVSPISDGFLAFYNKINETNTYYIQVENNFGFFYWFFKLLIRLALVLLSLVGVSVFAIHSLRYVFHFQSRHLLFWKRMLLLFLWLLLLIFAVSLGKRVFFHYFVFLLAPLCLMAAVGVDKFDSKLKALASSSQTQNQSAPRRRFRVIFFSKTFLKAVRQSLSILLLLPAMGFFVEGALNFSTRPLKIPRAIEYVKSNTKPDDRIYIWGNVPQLYFYSERLPSTVYFWSDTLAGTSPGSPAMEYIRATGKSLQVSEMLKKDFEPKVFSKKSPDFYKNIQGQLSRISDHDLFTMGEIIELIEHPYWQKVMADFLNNPPELFIDSSPSNIRGFGYYPVFKYELLKRFVLDNYKIETVVNGLIIYRLQKKAE